jgi:hypothetical protein
MYLMLSFILHIARYAVNQDTATRSTPYFPIEASSGLGICSLNATESHSVCYFFSLRSISEPLQVNVDLESARQLRDRQLEVKLFGIKDTTEEPIHMGSSFVSLSPLFDRYVR